MSDKIINEEYALVPIASLTEHPENPRRGDVPAITESIIHNPDFTA